MKNDLNQGAKLRTATPLFNRNGNLQPDPSFLRIGFLLLMVLFGCITLAKASRPQPKLAAYYGGARTIVIQLDTPVAAGSVCGLEELFGGVAGFEGMSSSVSLNAGGQTLTFTLTGGSGNALPAHQDVALLHLSDPVSGVEQDFLVLTDGGGTIMALDDF